jgi:hypothetical protein
MGGKNGWRERAKYHPPRILGRLPEDEEEGRNHEHEPGGYDEGAGRVWSEAQARQRKPYFCEELLVEIEDTAQEIDANLKKRVEKKGTIP